MEETYREKYRVAPARLHDWDYGSDGMYFVTICTKDRIPYFGEIRPLDVSQTIPETRSIASLHKTEIGKVAHNNFEKIPVFHTYVEVDEFVVMPDHIHGILFINKPDKTTWKLNKFGSQGKNLASIIRGYKSSVTTFATLNNIDFLWQPRYYDRVIRSEKEYRNIKGYIKDNPDQWYRTGEDFENLFKP